MRRLCIITLLLAALLPGRLRADTFQLSTGEPITGEPIPAGANDQGLQIKVGDGQYQRISWDKFSQEDLKKFKQNPKLETFVDPFIEITQADRIKKTEVQIKQPPRLPQPPPQSLFGAMFSSGLGIFILFILYAATIYAGYEVAVFRGKPVGLVAGLAAIPFLGIAAPIAFLCIPTKTEAAPLSWETAPAPAPGVPAAAAAEAVNPMQGDISANTPGSLHIHHDQPAAGQEQPKPALPETQVFQRGQFTFNRRFFETKFPGFFGAVRREGDKDMVVLLKAARGEYIVERITRIAANDLHVLVHYGQASQEVMVPFQEIKEVQLKHKDA